MNVIQTRRDIYVRNCNRRATVFGILSLMFGLVGAGFFVSVLALGMADNLGALLIHNELVMALLPLIMIPLAWLFAILARKNAYRKTLPLAVSGMIASLLSGLFVTMLMYGATRTGPANKILMAIMPILLLILAPLALYVSVAVVRRTQGRQI